MDELGQRRSEYAASREQAAQLTRDLSDAQLRWRPPEGGWSILECIDHLDRTGRVLLPAIDHAIERGRARRKFAEGPFRHGWLSRWFVAFMEPPPRRPVPTRPIVAPQPASVEQVMRSFAELQRELDDRLQRAAGLHLARIRVVSPLAPMGLMRYSLGAAFAIIAAHERRHLWQAANVRRHPQFP